MVEVSSRFRAGVAMIVLNHVGLVLALERADVSGAWQVPQGGLLDGEPPIEGASRELREETGIAWEDLELLAEHPLWLGYELPVEARSEKTGRGQVHKWFLLRYLGSDELIDLGGRGHEFGRWRWMRMGELVDVVWSLRRPIYERVAHEWTESIS